MKQFIRHELIYNTVVIDYLVSLYIGELMVEQMKINRLKIVLAEQDTSHKEFAHRMKKTPNTITRICNNQQQPSLNFLRKMAVELGVTMCDLLVPIEPQVKG